MNSMVDYYFIVNTNFYAILIGLLTFLGYNIIIYVYENQLDIMWKTMKCFSIIQINYNKYIYFPVQNNLCIPIKNYFYSKNVLTFVNNGNEIFKLNLNMFHNEMYISNKYNPYYNFSYDFIFLNINNLYNKISYHDNYSSNKNNSIMIYNNSIDLLKTYNTFELNRFNRNYNKYKKFRDYFKTNVKFLVCNLMYNNNCYPIDINPYIVYNNKILTYNFIKWYIINHTDITKEPNFNLNHFFDTYKIYIMDDNICEIYIHKSNYIMIEKNTYVTCHDYIEFNENDNEEQSINNLIESETRTDMNGESTESSDYNENSEDDNSEDISNQESSDGESSDKEVSEDWTLNNKKEICNKLCNICGTEHRNIHDDSNCDSDVDSNTDSDEEYYNSDIQDNISDFILQFICGVFFILLFNNFIHQ